MSLLAGAAAVLALLLLSPPRPRGPTAGTAARAAVPALALAGGLVVLAAGGAQRAALVLVVLAAGACLGELWRRLGRRRAAVATSARVLETCELLGAELGAGRPPGAALDRAAAHWSALLPAAEALALGSDVPDALRRVALGRGARDLRLLAAAWQVAHRTGHGLASAVQAVEEDLRAAQATRRVVESELSSARATARLLAVLPVPVLLMGGRAGADAWGFLVGTPLGVGCLALGLAFAVAGLWWIEALASAVWDSG